MPKKASRFLDELLAWGASTGMAAAEPGPSQASDDNPMLGLRASFVRPWPGPARPDETDELFTRGWRDAARDDVQPSLLEALSDEDRRSFDALASDRRALAAHLRERGADAGGTDRDRTPTTVSVGGVIDYATCPKRFYWTNVRPLPRFSGPAARIGTEIHRWIERRASGQGQLLEADDPVDLTHEELAGDPGRVGRLRESFLASRFAGVVPLYAERPFLLRVGAFTVGGRIDAIYGEPDGPWEIVDWKTGKGAADPLQLELYGLAAVEIWHKEPSELTLTYCYLAKDEIVSVPMGDPADVRARVEASLSSISAGSYEPTPGRWCTYCDFRSFCDAGRDWLAENA